MKRKWRARLDLKRDYYYVEYKTFLFWQDLDIYELGVYKWCKENNITYHVVSTDDYKNIYGFTSLNYALKTAMKAEEMMRARETNKIKEFVYFSDNFTIEDK